jgi:hypothetical protein
MGFDALGCLRNSPPPLRLPNPPPFLAKLQPGATIMADDNIERIPIKNLHQEDGAHELASSPDMEPYLNFAMALMQGNDPTPELDAIRQLPLEKRYVWRVASALKWAFADFDDLNVSADKETLAPEDFSKVSSAFF